MTTSSARGIVGIRSRYAFAETVQRVLAALAAHGIKVFAVIDHQAGASEIGLAMPPTTLIVFGNPAAGTPLMLERPSLALDLPSKALIAETAPGEVSVSFNAAQYLIERHTLPAGARDKLEGFLHVISAAIA